MTTDVKEKSIDWKDVAIVVFKEDKPVILSSCEPQSMSSLFCDLIEDDEDDEDSLFGETINERFGRIRNEIENYRWELHTTEHAKQLFCNAIEEVHDDE